MLGFKKFISEALNDEQKRKLGILYNNSPGYAAKQISKGVIPDNQSSIHIPLTHNTQQEVEGHLVKHGFQLKDYKSGLATDKHGRDISIAKILKSPKTQAPDHIVKGFENDARGDKISPETHHIVFSHDPEHIGECSTNKGWKSCASLTPKGNPTSYGSGVAAKAIPNAISAGTHVAYLMKKGETDLNKAHARILLHPYHSYDSEGNIQHTVLMPERKVYSKTGGRQSSFASSLEDFARTNYQMKPGKIYRKDPTVYDDDKQEVRFDTSPESVKKIAMSGYKEGVQPRHKEEALSQVQLPHQTITALLNHKSNDDYEKENLHNTHKLIAEHQKLSDAHVTHLLNSGHGLHLARNKNLSKSQVGQLVYHAGVESNSAESPDLQQARKNVNENLINRTHGSLINNQANKLTSDHIHHIIGRNDTDTLNSLAHSDANLNSEHIMRMAQHTPETYSGRLNADAINSRRQQVSEGMKGEVMARHGRKLSEEDRHHLANDSNTSSEVLMHLARHAQSHDLLHKLSSHANADSYTHAAIARRREDLN